jgi:hypothetical protein
MIRSLRMDSLERTAERERERERERTRSNSDGSGVKLEPLPVVNCVDRRLLNRCHCSLAHDYLVPARKEREKGRKKGKERDGNECPDVCKRTPSPKSRRTRAKEPISRIISIATESRMKRKTRSLHHYHKIRIGFVRCESLCFSKSPKVF